MKKKKVIAMSICFAAKSADIAFCPGLVLSACAFIDASGLAFRASAVAGRNAAMFFFQAEDGIRAHCVTGVQTCALPISGGDLRDPALRHFRRRAPAEGGQDRKSVVEGKSVDLGGRRIIKKTSVNAL